MRITLYLINQKQVKKCLFSTLFLFVSLCSFAQVGIGLENPAPYSILEIKSEYQGIRLPQLTTEQRTQLDALTIPPSFPDSNKNGLMIYHINSKCVEIWIEDKWVELVCYS